MDLDAPKSKVRDETYLYARKEFERNRHVTDRVRVFSFSWAFDLILTLSAQKGSD